MASNTEKALPELAIAEADIDRVLPFSPRTWRRMKSAGLTPDGVRIGKKLVYCRRHLELWATWGFPDGSAFAKRLATEGADR